MDRFGVKQVKDYWRNVISKAFRKTFSWDGFNEGGKELIRLLLLYFVLSIFSAVGLTAGGLISNLGWDIQSALLLLVISIPVRFISYLISIPREEYNTLVSLIGTLSEKNEFFKQELDWMNDKLDGGEIKVRLGPSTYHDKYATVLVYNGNRKSSVFCKPFLVHAEYGHDAESLPIPVGQGRLDWLNEPGVEELEIRPDKMAFALVAEFRAENYIFTLDGSSRPNPRTNYILGVEVQCRRNPDEKLFVRRFFWGCLETIGVNGTLPGNRIVGNCPDAEGLQKHFEYQEGKFDRYEQEQRNLIETKNKD